MTNLKKDSLENVFLGEALKPSKWELCQGFYQDTRLNAYFRISPWVYFVPSAIFHLGGQRSFLEL